MAGDKAYSLRAIRTHLRERGIGACIPEPDDQKGHRKRRGSRGGRPPDFDAERYRGRNVVERAFNEDKQWRSLPPATTSSPSSTGPEQSCARSSSGSRG